MPAIVLPRVDQLAVRRLGPFAEVPPVPIRSGPLTIPAYRAGFYEPDFQTSIRFERHKVNGREQWIVPQHPSAKVTWETWFQHVTVPTRFETAIYVPPPEFLEPEPLKGDGVLFRIYTGTKWTTERTLVFEGRYNPLLQSEPIPVRVDLKPYLNRRVVLQLHFETVGDASLYEHALWVEPRIIMELTEEAARAKYYPPQ
ncbi:MAG: hypothetical protein NZ571_00950 [Anaerolineae bacterium]|nr:hypothetical protein [Anaerolineae bacterium]